MYACLTLYMCVRVCVCVFRPLRTDLPYICCSTIHTQGDKEDTGMARSIARQVIDVRFVQILHTMS